MLKCEQRDCLRQHLSPMVPVMVMEIAVSSPRRPSFSTSKDPMFAHVVAHVGVLGNSSDDDALHGSAQVFLVDGCGDCGHVL